VVYMVQYPTRANSELRSRVRNLVYQAIMK